MRLSDGSSYRCPSVLGIAAGMLAGYYGGWLDNLVSRLGDVLLAFPALVLYVILITAVGPSMLNIALTVTLAYAPVVSRAEERRVGKEWVSMWRFRGASCSKKKNRQSHNNLKPK